MLFAHCTARHARIGVANRIFLTGWRLMPQAPEFVLLSASSVLALQKVLVRAAYIGTLLALACANFLNISVA